MSAEPSYRSRYLRLSLDLIRCREAAGLTQNDVAACQNVSRSTVQRWEAGQGVPNAMQLFRWADQVGIDITHHIHSAEASDLTL